MSRFKHEHTYKADTHTHTHSHQHAHLSMLLLLNNISKSKTLEASPPCSYLPGLSLLGAGASVPLVRQGSLSFPAPGCVRGGGPLPVLPVFVLRPVLTPSLSCTLSTFLLWWRALSFAGVRCSFSGGPEEEQSATGLFRKTVLDVWERVTPAGVSKQETCSVQQD